MLLESEKVKFEQMTSYGIKEALVKVTSLYGVDLSVEGQVITQAESKIQWQKLEFPT